MHQEVTRNGTGATTSGEAQDVEVLPEQRVYPLRRGIGIGVNRDFVMFGLGAAAVLGIMYLISRCNGKR